MKLDFKIEYHCLAPFEIELPDFTVITGVNGSGKTRLLSLLQYKNSIQQRDSILELTEDSINLFPRQYIASNSFSPHRENHETRENVKSYTTDLWNNFRSFQQNRSVKTWETIEDTNYSASIKKGIYEVAKLANKPVKDLIENDFYDYAPLTYLDPDNVFYKNLALLFNIYRNKLDRNQYKQFLAQNKGYINIEYLTDDAFIQKFGEPPWDFLNKIIDKINLGYHIILPDIADNDKPYELKFINNITGDEIPFTGLSSGENVLMALALALYNASSHLEFPKVLLLDEPDASLHPSMTKQLLDVIEEVFVKNKGLKVLMSTHSPSTVALAPEESLFVMNKIEHKLEKTSKDKALRILTEGVPSLSINYENRRQVFVESENDVYFYGKLYDKLKNYLIPEISLNFISSGIGNTGNCEQVKKVVNQLASFGNRYIFGIIDWDLNNNENDYVKVLGKDKRYSIENYIFDSILIAAYLLRERFITREDLYLNNNETYADFKNLSQIQLQTISDFITNKIQSLVNPTDAAKFTVKYLSGMELEVPQWYLIQQGHNLENHIKNAFPQLQRFRDEGTLKKEIINKVVDDIPELIPLDILELFQLIQTR